MQRSYNHVSRLQLTVICNLAIPPEDLINKAANLFHQGELLIHGLIIEAHFLAYHEAHSWYRYELIIKDKLHLLAIREGTQVFRRCSSRKIIEQLFQRAVADDRHCSLSCETENEGAIRPWLWQWQQSDLSLIQTLCAAESWIIIPQWIRKSGQVISCYRLLDRRHLKKYQLSNESIPYRPLKSLAPMHHRSLHDIELIYETSTQHGNTLSWLSLHAATNYPRWQIGQLIHINTHNNVQSEMNRKKIESTTWCVAKINLKHLKNKNSAHEARCKLQLIPVDNMPLLRAYKMSHIKKPADSPCHLIITATVICKAKVTVDGNMSAIKKEMQATLNTHQENTNHGNTNQRNTNQGSEAADYAQQNPPLKNANELYAIAFDHEAENNPPQEPYVPYLAQAMGVETTPLGRKKKKASAINHAENKQHQTSCAIGSACQLTSGSRVLVKMLCGDTNFPIIIGCIASKKHPSPVTHENPQQHIIATGEGFGMMLEDNETYGCSKLHSPEKLQHITTHSAHTPIGLSIENQQGNIEQLCENYKSESKRLRIKTKKNLQMTCKNSLTLNTETGDINFQSHHLYQQTGADLKFHSDKQDIAIQCREINFNSKTNIDMECEQGDDIIFKADYGSLQFEHRSSINIKAKENMAMKTAASGMGLSAGSIKLNAATITLSAASILVSGC